MYRENEAQIFESPDHVPPNEGWVDSPALVAPREKPAAEATNSLAAGSLDLAALSLDDLKEIVSKAGVKIDGRWGRARIEQALKEA
jgi:hypothetical protein